METLNWVVLNAQALASLFIALGTATALIGASWAMVCIVRYETRKRP